MTAFLRIPFILFDVLAMVGDDYKGVLVCSPVHVISHDPRFLKGSRLVEIRIANCPETILLNHAILMITCYGVALMVHWSFCWFRSSGFLLLEPLSPWSTLLSISAIWRLFYEPLAPNLLLGPQAVGLVAVSHWLGYSPSLHTLYWPTRYYSIVYMLFQFIIFPGIWNAGVRVLSPAHLRC